MTTGVTASAALSRARPAVATVRRFGYGRALSGTRLAPTTVRAAHVASLRKRRVTTQMGLFGLGAPELIVIAGVAALIFGPSKLPELGKTLGKSVKNVQAAAKEFQDEMQKEIDKDDAPEPPVSESDRPLSPTSSGEEST